MEIGTREITLFRDFRNTTYDDFYIDVFLTKSFRKVDEYIDVEKDDLRTSIDRQLVNPYFIELAFFETIKSINVSGSTNTTVSSPWEAVEDKAKFFRIDILK